MQKDVADRLCAKVGNTCYGRNADVNQFRCTIMILLHLIKLLIHA